MLTREYAPGNSVSHFPYHQLVATGEMDRSEWAAIVQELLDELGPRMKAKFARTLETDPKTIDNWLAGRVKVTEESIRKVAERTGHNAMEWLIRVGYYRVDDLPYRPDGLTDEEITDEEQRVIANADLDDETKKAIIDELEEMRAHDERLLEEQRERDKQRRMREIAWRIEQARSTTA